MQVKQNYHSKVELETFIEKHGVLDASHAEDLLEAKQLNHYRKLLAQVKQEQKQNEEDTHIYFGRELRHSIPVQLLHVKSQKVNLFCCCVQITKRAVSLLHTTEISFFCLRSTFGFVSTTRLMQRVATFR